jgi:hypothetical protein
MFETGLARLDQRGDIGDSPHRMRKVRKKAAPIARWSKSVEGLRAIAIKQPWAWLIVNGYKDIENRSWQTRYRGTLLINAGTSHSDVTESTRRRILRRYGLKLPDEFDFGGVIGMADVIDCRSRTDSPWHIPGARDIM